MSSLRLMAIDSICQRGSIRDSDVATLRRAFTLENHIAATDIDGLFRANALARVQDPSWHDFFIETLTDYVVRELEPAGYVTAAHAGWLIARVSQAGRVRTKTEQDLLLNVIDKARWVPESLVSFALAQIRDAVITGEGPLRIGAEPDTGRITLAEVEQIRKLLFAYGNEGPKAITQTEAELLLQIDRAITTKSAEASNTPASPLESWPLEAWQDLVRKALTSAILSASGYAGASREEALNEFQALTSELVIRQFPQDAIRSPRMGNAAATHGSVVAGYQRLSPEALALLRLELQRIEIITAEPVVPANGPRLSAIMATADFGTSPVAALPRLLQSQGFDLHSAFACPRETTGVHAA